MQLKRHLFCVISSGHWVGGCRLRSPHLTARNPLQTSPTSLLISDLSLDCLHAPKPLFMPRDLAGVWGSCNE